MRKLWIMLLLLLTGCQSGGPIKKAESLFRSQKYDESIDLYRSVFESRQSPPLQRAVAGVAMGQIYTLQKKFKEAHQVLARVRSMSPPKKYLAYAYFQDATVLRLMKKNEKSLAAYEKYLRDADPQNPMTREALHYRIRLGISLKRYNSALDGISAWLENYPGDANSKHLKLRGDILVLLSKEEEARVVYEEWLRAYPGDPAVPDVLYWMGSHFLEKNDRPGAEEYFRTLVDNHPGSMWEDDILNWLTRENFKSGKYDQSLHYATGIIDKKDESMWREDAYLYAIKSALSLSRKKYAGTLFSRFQTLYPDSDYMEKIHNLF